MGTLIPMGPGLAALGSGDVTTLAAAIIVAFDTTVIGIGAGAVAYFASKIRRRWYEQYLSNLDVDCIILGCTHYPHIKNEIQKLFPNSNIIDGNIGVAKRVKFILEEKCPKIPFKKT